MPLCLRHLRHLHLCGRCTSAPLHPCAGAPAQVPPPANKSERLYVCGDTHGQLQDVLWIFELHNEPAPGNAFLFNGDMADRGANARRHVRREGPQRAYRVPT